MSEFDDEEYESFELDGAGKSADSVKRSGKYRRRVR